jgi:uncharacterized glyoxalase superfamily protein PhnB
VAGGGASITGNSVLTLGGAAATDARVVRPPGGGSGAQLLLARASTPDQQARVGSQTGGRVGFFLYTDDFWRDHARFTAHGIEFVRGPAEQPYGTVAVFKDLYGNLWDFVQLKA